MKKIISLMAMLLITNTAVAHPGHHDHFQLSSFFESLWQWGQHMLSSDYHLLELVVVVASIAVLSMVKRYRKKAKLKTANS